ncbi:tetratricopeptide repeat-containing sensor histidine kinase [Rhodoflexus sp.]
MTDRSILYLLIYCLPLIAISSFAFADDIESLKISADVKGRMYLKIAKDSAISNPLKGFDFINKGLSLGDKLSELTRAELQMELGNYHRLTGDYTTAINNLLAVLSVFEKYKIDTLAADCYNNLAVAYFLAGKSGDAEKAFRSALKIYKQIGNDIRVAKALNNIGEIYQRRGDPETAESYYQQAYALALEQGDIHMQAVVINNFGDTNYNLAKYSRAIYFQHQALLMTEALKDVEGISYSLLGLAKAHNKLSAYDSALYYADKGLAIAKENGINYLIKEGLMILKDIHASSGNFEKSMRYADSVISLIDTIYNQDKSKLIAQSMFQYQLGQQQSRIDLLAQYKINAELTQNITLTILAACVSFVGLLLYFARQRQIHNEELSQKNQMLDQKNKELNALNATKDKLFSIIAHDLRAPLGAMKNVLDLVDFNLLKPTEFAEIAVDIRKNLQNILYTLNNLLEWSYLQIKDGDTVHQEINDLRELIAETVAFYKEVARQKEIDIITAIDHQAYAKADKNHLRFVLRNLLNNAIKFSYPKSKIVIYATTTADNRVEIAITDTGAGIDEAVKEQLFSPAVRSTKGTAGEQGTGLGLMLCKDFIQKNNGEIFVDSQVGKGTTFKIILWHQ